MNEKHIKWTHLLNKRLQFTAQTRCAFQDKQSTSGSTDIALVLRFK